MVYVVDVHQQAQEKNMCWRDYPTIGITKNGVIRKGRNLSHYYFSWEHYFAEQVKTGVEEKINSDVQESWKI